MKEDWRGDVSIKTSKKAQSLIGKSFIQTLAHRKRQADGTNVSRSGTKWARMTTAHFARRRDIGETE